MHLKLGVLDPPLRGKSQPRGTTSDRALLVRGLGFRAWRLGLGFRAYGLIGGYKAPDIGHLQSADLGGRVGWGLPKAERVKTLFLSPLGGGG